MLACIHGISNGPDPGDFARGLGIHYTPILWAKVAESISAPSNDAANFVVDLLAYHGRGRKVIMDTVDAQLHAARRPVVVAHSLGTVILFDLIMRWHVRGIPRPFKRCAFLSSPLTINLPYRPDIGYRNRLYAAQGLTDLAPVNAHHFYDLDDSVVHGRVWGKAHARQFEREPVLYRLGFKDCPVESGLHLLSHINIWKNPAVRAHVQGLLHDQD